MNHQKIVIVTLSLIGGLFNLSGSLAEVFFPIIGLTAGQTGGFSNPWLGYAAILFSALAIVAIFFIKTKPKLAGLMLIISAVVNLLISISIGYIFSFILLVVAGVMCLLNKKL